MDIINTVERNLIALLFAAVACGPSVAPSLVQSTVVPTDRVPAGVVTGVVLDSTAAKPLAGVQIWFQPDSGGVNTGAVSNDAGRFRILDLPGGPGRLHWEFLGYASEQMRLTVERQRGYAARLVLRPVPICVCIDFLHARPAVSVSVRDVVTGGVPESDVTLVLRDGGYADTVFAEVESLPDTASVLVAGAAGRAGTYDVSVFSHGYRTWQVKGVVVDLDCCNSLRPRRLTAWLVPRD